MPIVTLSTGDLSSALGSYSDAMLRVIHENSELLLLFMDDDVIRPSFAENFARSGIKSRSGVMSRAVSTRGASGAVDSASGGVLTVGVDYNQYPYFKWVMEGRGAVVARNAKALHFFINGKEFFRKRVGPAPARPVIFVTQTVLDKGSKYIADLVLELAEEAVGF